MQDFGLTGGVGGLGLAHRQKIRRTSRLADFRAAALNQNAKHNGKQNATHNTDNRYAVHTDPPFLSYCINDLNDSIMMMAAGPRVTRNSEGKMKSTSGKISLMVVLAAISSTC